MVVLSNDSFEFINEKRITRYALTIRAKKQTKDRVVHLKNDRRCCSCCFCVNSLLRFRPFVIPSILLCYCCSDRWPLPYSILTLSSIIDKRMPYVYLHNTSTGMSIIVEWRLVYSYYAVHGGSKTVSAPYYVLVSSYCISTTQTEFHFLMINVYTSTVLCSNMLSQQIKPCWLHV